HRAQARRTDRRIPPEERRVQEGRGPDERPRCRREELPETEVDDHRREREGRTHCRSAGRRSAIARRHPCVPAGTHGYGGGSACDCRAGRPPGHAHGHTLVELLFVLAILAILCAATVPVVTAGADRSRTAVAARHVGSLIATARSLAVMRSTHVAIRFG